MAKVLTPSQAANLGLPGRKSLEMVSGAMGSQAVTLRLVEIPVPVEGEAERGPHSHDDFEECIYVLSGEACSEVDGRKHPLRAGDAILVAPGERHVTRNTGSVPLMLLCFFPVARVTARNHSAVTGR